MSMVNDEGLLGKRVVARTVQGDVVGYGKVIGYCDAPTYSIEKLDGTRLNWRADLCELVSELSANDVEFIEFIDERLRFLIECGANTKDAESILLELVALK